MGLSRKFSLRLKLIGMVLGIAVVLGTASFVSIWQMRSNFQSETLERFGEEATAVGAAIAAQFYERYGDVQAFAVNPSVRSMKPEEMQPDLDTYVGLYGIYDLIIVVDADGHYVSSNTKDIAGKDIHINDLKKIDYKTIPWFQSAIAGKFTEYKENAYAGTLFEDPAVDPVLSKASGEDRISAGFTTTIKDKAGKVVGVISNRSNTKWYDTELMTNLKKLKAGGVEDGEISLLNKDGLVITEIRPEGDKFELDYSPKTFLKKDMVKMHVPAGKMAMVGSGGVISRDMTDGGEDMTGYAHIDGPKWIPALGWSILIHDNYEDGMKLINAAMHFYLFTFGTIFLLGVGAATWFAINLDRSIGNITKTLEENADNLTETSNKVAVSSTDLSEGSAEQAAAVQETVAAVDEINAMIGKNADSAKHSMEASARSRDAAKRGRDSVQSMLKAIEEISQSNNQVSGQMEQNNTRMLEITKLIDDINAKTKVINEIVFQTKLLSFNASVEAARAGEAGKGFAVVAEEIGNLAKMSGQSATEIASLLDESVAKVQQIIDDSKSKVDQLIADAKQKVKVGSDTANVCNDVLEDILTEVAAVDSMVSEISVASKEQATGIHEIANAMTQMQDVTQRSSHIAAQSQNTAQGLNEQSEGIKKIVHELNQIVYGDKKTSKKTNSDSNTSEDLTSADEVDQADTHTEANNLRLVRAAG